MRNKPSEVKKKGVLEMPVRAWIRWILFSLYCTTLISAPFGILWGLRGAYVGLGISFIFITLLGYNGSQRLRKRLQARRLTRAEAPIIHNWAQEYCRRLGMSCPKIATIETPAVNLALYGFSRDQTTLVITEGALKSLRKDELSALIGWQICDSYFGQVFCKSWLSQFLNLLDPYSGQFSKPASARKFPKQYPLRIFLQQAFSYPISIIPIKLLGSGPDPKKIDVFAARLTGKPRALSEGLRVVEAMKQRHAYQVPISIRHLFLLSPPSQDPLVRIFFEGESISPRISAIEGLNHVVALS